MMSRQSFRHKYVLYLPSVDRKGNVIRLSNRVLFESEVLKKLLATGVGGATAQHEAQGYWVSKAGHLVNEEVTLVTFFTDYTPEDLGDKGFGPYTVLDLYDQESVAIEYDGEMFLFDGTLEDE